MRLPVVVFFDQCHITGMTRGKMIDRDMEVHTGALATFNPRRSTSLGLRCYAGCYIAPRKDFGTNTPTSASRFCYFCVSAMETSTLERGATC
jgi:hypothetical protein